MTLARIVRWNIALVGSSWNIALVGSSWSIALVGLLLAMPFPASAYADPGAGAFLYQAAYAAFIGGMFYFRKFIAKIWKR